MNMEQRELTKLATALEGRGHEKQANTVRSLIIEKSAGFTKGYGIPDQGKGRRGRETTAAWEAVQKLLWQASFFAKTKGSGDVSKEEWNNFVEATMAGDNVWSMSIDPQNWTSYKTGYKLNSAATGKMIWWFPTGFYNALTSWMKENNEYAQTHLKIIMRTSHLRRNKGKIMYIKWLVPQGLTREQTAYYALDGERAADKIDSKFAAGAVITLGIYESNYNDPKVVDALKIWKAENVAKHNWKQAHGSHDRQPTGKGHWDRDACLMVGYAKAGGEWVAAVETARSSGKYEPIALEDVKLDSDDKSEKGTEKAGAVRSDTLIKTALDCAPGTVPSNDKKTCLTPAQKAKDTTKAPGDAAGPAPSVVQPDSSRASGSVWSVTGGKWKSKDSAGKVHGPFATEKEAKDATVDPAKKKKKKTSKPRQSMAVLTDQKITKKEEGDAFRDWVNESPDRKKKAPTLWTSKKSDAKGVKNSWRNSTIRKAWKTGLGSDWVADTSVGSSFKQEEGGPQANIKKTLDQDTLKAYMLYPKPLTERDAYLAPYGDEFTTKTLLAAKSPDEITARNKNLDLFTEAGGLPAEELSDKYRIDTSDTLPDGKPNPAGRALRWEIRKSIAKVKAALEKTKEDKKKADEAKKSSVNSNDFFIIGEGGKEVRFDQETGLPPVGTLFIRKRDGEDFYLASFDGKATLINLRRRAGGVGLSSPGQSVMSTAEKDALLRRVPKVDEKKWKQFLSDRQEYRQELTKRRGDDDSGFFDQSRKTDRRQFNEAGAALFGEDPWKYRATGGSKPEPKGRKGQQTPIVVQ